ncbi:NADH peroxidase/oxidase [Thermoplasma volcanium GSS1]|uniref:NADH peroxidase/oxidase n=1 Tax=Thermoplasma volcanium (strain ATCC 51530 / DSM 4299 / JCM 9571 / NBRC 15438 / GSS1) TaxID=273116 RepID=Q97AI0_THEVO|nr:FAD-dependent oxidoreductase [Thermoplasma volcanium]BAB59972.1 NADH peroxidase/oxidase [Thermoplasma volcanium GSS1]
MKIIVIGGGAAGMSAASKAKRVNPDSEVIVVESGSYVSYAECGIPYYLQGVVGHIEDLLHYPLSEFTEKRGIKVLLHTTVTRIDTLHSSVLLNNGDVLKYDRLIIATGSRPKPIDVISDRTISIRSLESAMRARNLIEKSKDVTIVGAGVLGVELASVLAESGKNVKVISKYDRVLPQLDEDIGKIFHEYFSSRIDVQKQSSLKSAEEDRGRVKITTSVDDHECDAVIYATGIIPNSEIAVEAGIKTGDRNAILTNGHMETSEPGVYAAGDVATVRNIVTGLDEMMPLAQIANKAGRVAGSNASNSEMVFPGALGTTLVKVFDYEVGFTGINESRAKALGIPYEKTLIKAKSRANYYPGKQDIYVKIIYGKNDKRLLGAQVIGTDGAAWRLNTIATAIFGGFKVSDLFYDDLGYTPPFGPVWDSIVIAGSVSMRE